MKHNTLAWRLSDAWEQPGLQPGCTASHTICLMLKTVFTYTLTWSFPRKQETWFSPFSTAFCSRALISVLPFPKILPYLCLFFSCTGRRLYTVFYCRNGPKKIWLYWDKDLFLMILYWLNQGCLYLIFLSLSLILFIPWNKQTNKLQFPSYIWNIIKLRTTLPQKPHGNWNPLSWTTVNAISSSVRVFVALFGFSETLICAVRDH